MRTAADIASLMADWLDDRTWDIEHTTGFEAHAEELRAYRLQVEAEERAAQGRQLSERAASLGFTVKQMALIVELEQSINVLRLRVKELEEKAAQ